MLRRITVTPRREGALFPGGVFASAPTRVPLVQAEIGNQPAPLLPCSAPAQAWKPPCHPEKF